MNDTPDALDELAFLSASPNRLRLLDALADGASTPDELGETLSLPRSTLQRNLSSLTDRGYVRYDPASNRYESTVAGELARDALDGALDKVSTAVDLSPFLDELPIDLPVDAAALTDCDVIMASSESPFDPVAAIKRHVSDAGSVRGFFPTVNPIYVEAMQRYEPGAVRVEAIAPPQAYEALMENYRKLLERMTSVETVDLYESPDVPEYALAFAGENLLLGAFDDRMRTHSVLLARTDVPLFEWAEETYQEIKSSATPVE